MMQTKKYVLFVVEGKNDQIEIQAMLRAFSSDIIKEKYVDVYYPYNGDITFDEKENTIVGKINNLVVSWRRGETRIHPCYPVSPSDVAKIIHVIDMDGAFIPEKAILTEDVGVVEYTGENIIYSDRSFIVGRNRRKAKNIRKLLTVKSIDNIPYEVFFMSCNMDHVLHNKQNSSDEEKEKDALLFAKRYKQDIEGFIKFIAESDFSVRSNYVESWNYIKQERPSLERHTNLGLCLTSASKIYM